MITYVTKRLVFLVVALFGISLLSFVIIHFAPGGPIEQKIFQIQFGGHSSMGGTNFGVSEQYVEILKRQYGFDRPVLIRFGLWLSNLMHLDFGESFTYQRPVTEVIALKLPVSLQFGIMALLLAYLIAVPLGILMAMKEGSSFDAVSTFALLVLYAVPPLIMGVMLRVVFSGSQFLNWFPMGELYSDFYETMSTWGKFVDRLYHLVLPLICYTLTHLTVLTLVVKNSILDEIKQDYIVTVRSKGIAEKWIYWRHALRNSLVPLVTGVGGYVAVFFSGSVVIEQIFNLDGLGLLGYKAALDRDYNVLMGLVFCQSAVFLLGRFATDIFYTLVDPRVKFRY